MSPRLNHPPGRPLDDLTIGQLKAALASGDETATLAEALDTIAEATRISVAHEAATHMYGEYVARRQARHAHALEAAAASVPVDPRMATTDTYQRRQEARRDAAETFEIREPLLGFADWVDHDRPEVYEVGAIKRAFRAVTRQEIVH